MKAEQRGLEGIDGILSSMNEQDQPRGKLFFDESHLLSSMTAFLAEVGLVGDENEMDLPISSNGI